VVQQPAPDVRRCRLGRAEPGDRAFVLGFDRQYRILGSKKL
jgi:hypothetical protein